MGMDQPVAAECLHKIVSCGCKAGYGRACSYQKLGLHSSQMCSHSLGTKGHICTNIQVIDNESNEDILSIAEL